MSITVERKAELVEEFGLKPGDTGSPEVQVAILTERIKNLTEHMKEHGLTDGRFLTHSLRRGGVCALLMAGMSKDDVMHFGRWKSQSGFENYVSVIYETLAEFAHLVYKRVGTFDVR